MYAFFVLKAVELYGLFFLRPSIYYPIKVAALTNGWPARHLV